MARLYIIIDTDKNFDLLLEHIEGDIVTATDSLDSFNAAIARDTETITYEEFDKITAKSYWYRRAQTLCAD